jgi:protein-S-isoprenylcysteine O-methyltransferase Ste14
MDLTPLLSRRGRALAWLVLTAGLALHVADEAAHDFLAVYNPNVLRMRQTLPLLPIPTFTFETWIAGLAIAVAVLLALTACVVRGQRWTIRAGYFYGAIMLANGLAHVSSSLILGRLMPGVLSSPLIIGLSIVLILALAGRSDSDRHRGTATPPGRVSQLGWPQRVGLFGLTLLIWGALARSESTQIVSGLIIVGALLLVFPTVYIGRRFLDARPTPEQAAALNIPVHYALMILFGAAIIEAVKTGQAWRGFVLPLPAGLGLALLRATAIATLLTVLNLAARGLGAPFAIALSRRLATDWLYHWTRNPMVLATLACLLSFGLWIRSSLFVLWVLCLATPAWLAFLKIYEERELEIRFGESYLRYKARTPMLFPGRPRRLLADRKCRASEVC